MTINPATLQRLTPHDFEYCDNKASLIRRFNKDTEGHVMTTLHEDGLYRHLRFRSPEIGWGWFDLITWPGHLTINGDMGTYTFARVEDMFTFFTGYINTHYWSEKEKGRGRSELKEHDGDEFKTWIVQDFWDTSRDMDADLTKRWWATIRENVFDRHSFHNTDHREGCNDAVDDIIHEGVAPKRHYQDLWDNDWTKYPWHLEYCMASIVAGIRTYNAVKKAAFLATALVDEEGQRLVQGIIDRVEAAK
ncbi:hypothetical protein [Arthrobacter cryoconiti]|uniref:Uncharacterized protein n=1 Tax=Arthrobacter cryoconiti TaxID=748907 RepID=A0ABV8QXK2_9MICC|nr:hypothetical protein [Arthrobacter cryoconiti]MCC9068834.1 hypothetical protein [Arthrobacter cryoconiti]